MLDKAIGAKAEVRDDKGEITRPALPGRMFRFDKLPVEDGLDLLLKVAKTFGTSLAGLQSGSLGNPTELGSKIVGNLTGRLNEGEAKEIIKKLLACTSCLDASNVDAAGKPTGKVDINRTFAGRYFELFQVAVESFKYNFADFLAEIGSILSVDESATASSQLSQPTSTGGSGAP